MKVLHLLWSCDYGGIEKLCLEIGKIRMESHEFCVLHAGGITYEKMQNMGIKTSCLSCSSKEFIKAYKILSKKLKLNRLQMFFCTMMHRYYGLWDVC